MNYEYWSVLPPLIAILFALKTKQVYLSLILGIWAGWVIINGGNVLSGSYDTLAAFVAVFENPDNTRTIIFTLFIGALIALIQRSGGVDGFILRVNDKLLAAQKKQEAKGNHRTVQFLAALTGLLIFVEANISILTVGTLFRPIFDRLKLPREKLAYLADSSSAPSCIIFPFNAWGAYIMGLLLMQGFENPFAVLYQSILFNFYPFIALAIVFTTVATGKDWGAMKKAMLRAEQEGKLLADSATPMIADEIAMLEAKEGVSHRAINMVLPIVTMILMMPCMLIYTGWGQTNAAGDMGTLSHALSAIGHGSGSISVLYSVSMSILVAMILYKSQALLGIREMIDLSLKGMSGMLSLAILMALAFAIGTLCKELGTGVYVAEITKSWLSPSLVPAIIFITSCFIAFSTGTSWGTFAIMISIAVPIAQSFDTNVNLAIAAALGGGIFGDHCSPISDTTIISSMASASDHIDHVNTQIPYALLGGGITTLLYLIIGFLS